MSWWKSMLLSLVKNEVAAHLDLMDGIKPKIVDAMSKKGIDATQANALADAVLAIVKTEVAELINKL